MGCGSSVPAGGIDAIPQNTAKAGKAYVEGVALGEAIQPGEGRVQATTLADPCSPKLAKAASKSRHSTRFSGTNESRQFAVIARLAIFDAKFALCLRVCSPCHFDLMSTISSNMCIRTFGSRGQIPLLQTIRYTSVVRRAV